MIVKTGGGVGAERGEHKWDVLNCILKYVKSRVLMYFALCDCELSTGVSSPPGGSRGLAAAGGGGGVGGEEGGASSPPVGEGQRRLAHHSLNAAPHGGSQITLESRQTDEGQRITLGRTMGTVSSTHSWDCGRPPLTR